MEVWSRSDEMNGIPLWWGLDVYISHHQRTKKSSNFRKNCILPVLELWKSSFNIDTPVVLLSSVCQLFIIISTFIRGLLILLNWLLTISLRRLTQLWRDDVSVIIITCIVYGSTNGPHYLRFSWDQIPTSLSLFLRFHF